MRRWLSATSPNQAVFYRAESINRHRIIKHSLFGIGSVGLFSGMEVLLYTTPEFPFSEYVPHLGLAASLGFLAWRFKACRDTVFDMTRNSDDGVLGIRGLTLFGNPVKQPAYFYVNDLQYHAPGFDDHHQFFYVSVIRGEYFRMFRFEHHNEVDKLFKVQSGNQSSLSPPTRPRLHILPQPERKKRRVVQDTNKT
ncbi:hypothetical protein BASA81_014028 [Batrachochytrium salamandrivorans]|nr:hypothetical protein BASA81_014028 [Batrachochytrium salamandrivorans]